MNSDRELENVSGRLAGLERMLESFVGRHDNKSITASPSTSSGGQTLSTPRDSQLVWRDQDYEGDSSFSAHSKSIITQLLETGLKHTSDADGGPVGDVAAAVKTLRSLLNETPASDGASVPQNPLTEVVDYPELSNLTLPPMSVVLNLLRYVKSMHKYLSYICLCMNDCFVASCWPLTSNSTRPQIPQRRPESNTTVSKLDMPEGLLSHRRVYYRHLHHCSRLSL